MLLLLSRTSTSFGYATDYNGNNSEVVVGSKAENDDCVPLDENKAGSW